MSYCPKCGRQILDENAGCPVCSEQGNTNNSWNTQPETVTEFTVEDQRGTSQRFESTPPPQNGPRSWESYQSADPKPVLDPSIPIVLKVIVILGILFTGGIGAVVGLIGGIILMKNPVADYRSFGKIITIISGAVLAISLICCIVYGGFFGILGSLDYYY